jgi:hypothetical protein
MEFVYCDLDDHTRQLMISEVDTDIADGTLVASKRFSDAGREVYPALLREAVSRGDESTLADALLAGPNFKPQEWVNRGQGYWRTVVASTAAKTFADGEFNRFFVRALALAALEADIALVEVYRAKAVSEPRAESEARIGASYPPSELLADLRAHKGFETAIGLGRPNSGLSARLTGRRAACEAPLDASGEFHAACHECAFRMRPLGTA